MSDPRPGVCIHGGLRRSCETCDLAEMLEQAERERDEARAEVLAMSDIAATYRRERDEARALLRECRKVLDGEWAKAEKRKRLIDRLAALLEGRDAGEVLR